MISQNLSTWSGDGQQADADLNHQLFDFLDLKFPQAPGKEDGEAKFRDAVHGAAVAVGGELLFDLPAEGLVANRRRIAVARIPGDDNTMRVVMATLDRDSPRIHMQTPDEKTMHLVGFANAFVGVFQRIGESA